MELAAMASMPRCCWTRWAQAEQSPVQVEITPLAPDFAEAKLLAPLILDARARDAQFERIQVGLATSHNRGFGHAHVAETSGPRPLYGDSRLSEALFQLALLIEELGFQLRCSILRDVRQFDRNRSAAFCGWRSARKRR
jgi:hypothetical protein